MCLEPNRSFHGRFIWQLLTSGTSQRKTKAMLEKAVAAVKQDKAKALDAFNAGEAGFKDRDLMCGAPTRQTAS